MVMMIKAKRATVHSQTRFVGQGLVAKCVKAKAILPIKTNTRAKLPLGSHCQAHQRTTFQATTYYNYNVTAVDFSNHYHHYNHHHQFVVIICND